MSTVVEVKGSSLPGNKIIMEESLPAPGFRTRPPIPLPIPLMRPAAPSFSAPRKGCVINPEIPS